MPIVEKPFNPLGQYNITQGTPHDYKIKGYDLSQQATVLVCTKCLKRRLVPVMFDQFTMVPKDAGCVEVVK